MNTWLKSSFLLTFLFFFVAIGGVEAQYGKKKKRKKRPETTEQSKTSREKTERVKSERLDQWAFKDRLWYGGGFNLGFSGSSAFSLFQFGLSPMVGYKIIDQWSVGPRIGFNYSYIKGTDSNGRIGKFQPVDLEFGVFTRFKVLPIIFTHVEYSISNEQPIFVDQFGRIAVDQDGNLVADRESKGNFYVGLGYHSDAELGYEFMVLFNLLEDEDSTRLPFTIRAGFNFRF